MNAVHHERDPATLMDCTTALDGVQLTVRAGRRAVDGHSSVIMISLPHQSLDSRRSC
jgi:hypothetical protein